MCKAKERRAEGEHGPGSKRVKPSPTEIPHSVEALTAATIGKERNRKQSPETPIVAKSSAGTARKWLTKGPSDYCRPGHINDEAKRATGERSPNFDLATLVRAPGARVPAEFRANPDIFPFLYLPAEIRLMVYRLLFRPDESVRPQVIGFQLGRNGFYKGVVLAMVCANKQLSREVTHFIYSHSRFCLSLRYHRDWITRIGHENARSLRRIRLVGEGPVQLAADQLCAMMATLRKHAAGNLRSLTIQHEWKGLDSAFSVRNLLAIAKTRSWKPFRSLRLIRIEVPLRHPPRTDVPLYEELCLQSRVRVVGARTGGEIWVERSPETLQSQAEKRREAKKQADNLKRKERRRAKKEKAKSLNRSGGAPNLEQGGSGLCDG